MFGRMIRSFFIILILIFVRPADGQVKWYVDDDAPGDPGPGNPNVSNPGEDGSIGRPFDAIQEAIDAASSGDIVAVADGTYTGTGNKLLTAGGKVLTISSTRGDPALCIIDCQNIGSGFLFVNSEPPAFTVSGFTFTKGSGFFGAGGAMGFSTNADPTIDNCIFTNNNVTGNGGVLDISSGSPTFNNCTFSGNTAGADGGAVRATASNASFNSCTFINNSSVGFGGAIDVTSSSNLTIDNCTFINNRSTDAGGGAVRCENSVVTIVGSAFTSNYTLTFGSGGGDGGAIRALFCTLDITGCTFSANTTNSINSDAGAIYNFSSTTLVEDCVFELNQVLGSTAGGGAIMTLDTGPLTVRGCLFRQNQAPGGGALTVASNSTATIEDSRFEDNTAGSAGAILTSLSSVLVITHSSFSGNQATFANGGAILSSGPMAVSSSVFRNNSSDSFGGAIYHSSTMDITIENSTFTDNVSLIGTGGAIYANGPGLVIIENSILWGNAPTNLSASGASLITTHFSIADFALGPGSFNADPQFVDPANGDLRLGPASPCIDHGDNGVVPISLTTDLDGNSRFVDGDGDTIAIVDMGAYEFDPASSSSVENLTQGSSHGTIAAALNLAVAGDELLASIGAFNAEPDIDFAGKAVTLSSTGAISQGSGDLYVLADGATLQSAPGMDTTIGGVLRVKSGDASDLVADDVLVGATGTLDIRNGAALFITSMGTTTLEGQTDLLALSTLGVVGPLTNNGTMIILNGDLSLDAFSNTGSLIGSSVSIVATGFNNSATGTVIIDGEIFSPIINDGNATYTGSTLVVGDYTNNDTTTVQIGTLTIIGSLINNGTIIGDVQTTLSLKSLFGGGSMTMPGDGMSITGDYTVGAGASLLMPTDVWRLSVGGDYDIAINNEVRYDMAEAELRLNGGDVQGVELMSLDIGADSDGHSRAFAGHFPLGTLRVGPGATIANLVDNHDNDGMGQVMCEALYVKTLIVDAGTTLNTNGCLVYYDSLTLNGTVDDPLNLVQVPAQSCPADVTGVDEVVNVEDLLILLGAWGACPSPCPPDIDGDDDVDVEDLLVLLGAWGACP